MLGRRLGPYRIEAELGSGGMGRVYRAVAERPSAGLAAGAPVALKIIHPHLLAGEGFFKRFLREAEIGRAVGHENVVRTYDCDQLMVEGVHYSFLVMEFVEGQTLRHLLDELGSVPEELCRHVGREITEGLRAIHEAGVVHRDLKPENVLITADHAVKIMDLGVARLQDEAIRLSRTGHFVGSILYSAPEAFQSAGTRLDGRADLYSLGVLLYELATGRHPYPHDDVKGVLHQLLNETPRRAGDVNPQLSPLFEEIVHTLIAKDPEDRFASAKELLPVLADGERSSWWNQRSRALRRATRRPLRRIRIPRETALYGREEELTRLTKAYEKARRGEGQVILIEGEAGIGKTRLVDEFVGGLRRDGEDVNFLFGSYPPGGAATAAGAFATAYREHFGAAALEDTLLGHVGEMRTMIPALAALLRGEAPPPGEAFLTPDGLQTAFVHATRALARERPTIVLCDDLHFAPSDGRALFASLALAVTGHGVLLIGTTRRRPTETWITDIDRLEHAGRIQVGRLGPKDLVRLLQDAFHSERLANELAGRIALKSDGNPFFAFEIIRGLRDLQLITQHPDGTWVSTQVIQEIQVPSSVLDLVNARVASLTREERELLDLASCCGFEFDPLPLAEVLALSRVEVLKALGQIERRHRLVRTAGRRFAFDHHQVQEALHESLSPLLREEYHAQIAGALESMHGRASGGTGEIDGALCVDLCDHYLRGARGTAALPYLASALDHLESGHVHDRAADLAGRALAIDGLLEGRERVELLLRLNARLDLLGRREAQAKLLEEARAVAEATGEKAVLARILGEQGWQLRHTGSLDQAKACFDRALEIYQSRGDRLGEAAMFGRLGTLARLHGRYEESCEHTERHRKIAHEEGSARGEAAATGNLGIVYLSMGQYEAARTQFERHRILAREIGDAFAEARAIGNLGLALRALGDYQAAREHFTQRLRFAREIGDRRGESLATGNLGLVYLDLGQIEDARAHDEAHLALSLEIGDREGEARALGNLGLVRYAQGNFEEARDLHARHAALARERDDVEGEARATGNLGLALFALGRYSEARRHHEKHGEISRRIGYREGESLAGGNLGLTLMSLGRIEEARDALETALDLAREIGDRRNVGYWLHGLGEVGVAAGDLDRARDLLEEALSVRREIGYRSGVAETLVRLGAVEGRRGELEAARTRLDEARRLGRDIGSDAVVVMALAEGTRRPDGDADVERAVEALAESSSRLGHDQQMEASFLLWQATRDRRHLENAERLLDHVVRHAEAEDRPSLVRHVPLHREIAEAWTAER